MSSPSGDTSSALDDGSASAAVGVGPELELFGEVSVLAPCPCVLKGEPLSEDGEFGVLSMSIESLKDGRARPPGGRRRPRRNRVVADSYAGLSPPFHV